MRNIDDSLLTHPIEGFLPPSPEPNANRGTVLSRLEEILTRSDIDGQFVSMSVPDTCEAVYFTSEDDETGLTAGSAVVGMPVLVSLSEEAIIDFVFEELADALKDSEELGGRTIYILQ